MDIKAANGPPPEAARAATYFWGAYSVRRYGAAATVPAGCDPLKPDEVAGWASHVSAIQLETSWEGVRDTVESREAFGRGLCEATKLLLKEWKGWTVGGRGLSTR